MSRREMSSNEASWWVLCHLLAPFVAIWCLQALSVDISLTPKTWLAMLGLILVFE